MKYQVSFHAKRRYLHVKRENNMLKMSNIYSNQLTNYRLQTNFWFGKTAFLRQDSPFDLSLSLMTFNVYLDQSSVLLLVQIFKHTLFPVTLQCPWGSLGAREALTSWFVIFALVSTRSHGSLRAGRSRDTCWSCGTSAPRDTWDSWRGTTATLTTSLFNSLSVEDDMRICELRNFP